MSRTTINVDSVPPLKLIAEKRLSDWVRTFSVGDIDDDRENEIVVGTTSNELICYKIVK